VLSLALYVLISFRYTNMRSIRAGTMYLVLAGFASGFLVFGLALVYAVYGTLELSALQQFVPETTPPLIAMIGIGLFLVGVGFKLSLVPFHMWAPEVYEAAPGAISGVIASASKGAILAAFIPFLFILRSHWQVIWVLAAASMIGGNLLALREKRLKRILAYSSIGHIGYMFIGYLAGWAIPDDRPAWAGSVLAWDDQGIMNSGVRAMLFYVIAYATGILGAFGVVSLMDREETVTVRDLRGVARRRPILAFCMMIFVVSLAGLPPTAGFFGKLYLFGAGISAGYVWLALIGLAGSAVGVYYYLRIIVNLFMLPPDTADVKTRETSLQTGLLVATAAAVVILGLFPDLIVGFLHPR
jgi:NADH-quinone oxidoreductase subunit N